MTELDTDERALHDYQNKHFSKIPNFIFRHMIRYGTVVGALLSGGLYLLTFRDIPRDPLLVLYPPNLTWPDVLLNYFVRLALGVVTGCVVATGLGFGYGKLIQDVCRKRILTEYVEPFDLRLRFVFYQITIPIPITLLIALMATPFIDRVEQNHVFIFLGATYVTVSWILGEVTRRFLKWYIPPLLPPLS